MDLAETLQQIHINLDPLQVDVDQSSYREYTAFSLFDLDAIWSSLLSEINMQYHYVERNYVYNSHAYHILGMQKLEQDTFGGIGRKVPETLYVI